MTDINDLKLEFLADENNLIDTKNCLHRVFANAEENGVIFGTEDELFNYIATVMAVTNISFEGIESSLKEKIKFLKK